MCIRDRRRVHGIIGMEMEGIIPFKKVAFEEGKPVKKIGSNTDIMKPLFEKSATHSKSICYAQSEGGHFIAKCFAAKENPDVASKEVRNFFNYCSGKRVIHTKIQDNYYFLSDYCNCGSLSQYLAKDFVLPEDEIMHFITQMSAQLLTLARAKMYHGELTPDHILINIKESNEIEYKICGLGHYVKKAPEFYQQPNVAPYIDLDILYNPTIEHDISSDIWSLGTLVYRLATGSILPTQEGWGQGPELLKFEYQPSPEISPSLNHFISRCLIIAAKERISPDEIPVHPLFLPQRKSLGSYIPSDDCLGSGKFANVYLWKNKDDPNVRYAAKILNPIRDLNKKDQMLVLGEISILTKIRHCPYIIKLYDYFEYQGKVHLILEYCNGKDLESYLKQKLSPHQIMEEVRMIVYNLASALQHMHSLNLIHRDIKPANIMMIIDPKTRRLIDAKLADFGTSRQSSALVETLVGSVGFFAPEMISQGIYGQKIDSWSFGIVLFFLAYRVTPLGVDPSHNVYSSQRIKFPAKGAFEISDEYKKLMLGCLEFNPEKRLSMIQVLRHEYFQSFPIVPQVSPQKDFEIKEAIYKTSSYGLHNTVHTASGTKLLTKIAPIGTFSEEKKSELKISIKSMMYTIGCEESCRLYSYFLVGTDIHFVLDYCEGETLYEYAGKIASSTNLAKLVSSIAWQVTKAIEFTHLRKVFPKKITPRHLYVCGVREDGFPRIKFAGISEFIQEIRELKGPAPGWPAYKKAPGEKDDTEAIFQIGALIYFMLFGNVIGYSVPLSFPKKDKLWEKEFLPLTTLIARCMNEKHLTVTQLLHDPFFSLFRK
eukprot:TRINITY_DN1065_c0_g1_i1.p1 TRINITY_DN1065_c0_g1~~TRINITY_DN1065_c0_g1_i1.p1  ORF type:complete len:824 (-),score=144.57 TRINITY_DN1065_c0_g1_i1:23-2494(-)